MSAVFEQVMAQCARGCFTGLLKVRTRDGSGEVRFLSGIQDGIRFASMEGDEALERLLAAREHEYEAISSLPPIDLGSTEPVPPEGGLDRFHAAQLMRYCESNSLTCALELEVNGKVLTARYRLGELLSVEPDSEHTAELAEAKRGVYRFRLPKFELPASIPQASRAAANGTPESAARPAAIAAKPAASVREPQPSAREAAPAARSAGRAAPASQQHPSPAAPPAAAKPAVAANKISPVAPIPISAPREASPVAARAAARPALDSAALAPSAAQSPLAAPSVRLERPAEPATRDQPAQTPRAPAAAAPSPARAAEAPAGSPKAARDAAPVAKERVAASAANGAARASSEARKAPSAGKMPAAKVDAGRRREQPARQSESHENPSSSRHWVILAVAIVAAAAGWFALNGSLP